MEDILVCFSEGCDVDTISGISISDMVKLVEEKQSLIDNIKRLKGDLKKKRKDLTQLIENREPIDQNKSAISKLFENSYGICINY